MLKKDLDYVERLFTDTVLKMRVLDAKQDALRLGISMLSSEKMPAIEFGSEMSEQSLILLSHIIDRDDNEEVLDWLYWFVYDNDFGRNDRVITISSDINATPTDVPIAPAEITIKVSSCLEMWEVIKTLYTEEDTP